MRHPWNILICVLLLNGASYAHTPIDKSKSKHFIIIDQTICEIDITVPDDTHLCEPGEFDLEGALDGNYEFVWCENGDDTSYDLIDEVDIDQSTTFTLKASYLSDENLIENGDFESGDSGFTTDYTPGQGNCFHGAGFLGCEGYYNVLDDPSLGHTNFDPCAGGPESGGNMMVVNGAPALQQIWCQDVCVDPEGTYLFNAWGASVNPGSPAELQFAIDGTLIGTVLGLPTTTCDWQYFEAEWEAGGETTIEICVTNQNTTAGGNDFAIDDIGFFRRCTEEASFEVTVSDFYLDYIEPAPITCRDLETEVTIDVDPLGNYDYDWDTFDGNILFDENGGATVIVDRGGEYYVTVTDEFGCTREEVIEVEEIVEAPEFDLDPYDGLDCNTLSTEIFIDYDDRDLEFTWTNQFNEEIGFEDYIEIEEGGEYNLTAFNTSNGCEKTIEFVVPVDTISPFFLLSKSNDLDCLNEVAEIRLSEAYPDVQWISPFNLLDAITDYIVEVNLEGYYYATVTLENGCTYTDSIEIITIEPVFNYQSQFDSLIDCNNPEAAIQIAIDTSILNFRWLNLGTANNDSLEISVSQSGTFYYQVSDERGCEKLDSVLIKDDLTQPSPIVVTAETIRCDRQEAAVVASNINSYQIEWQHENGISGNGDVFVTTEPGDIQYTLTGDNGCQLTDNITVETEGDFPEITITGGVIDCNTPSIDLAFTSNQSLQIAEWLLPDGSFSEQQTLNVNQGGTYALRAVSDQGCEVTTSYLVELDTMQPLLNLPEPLPLDCNNTIVSGTVELPLEYAEIITQGNWYDEQTNQFTITEGGIYDFTLVADNGCQVTRSMTVELDTIPPEFNIIGDTILNCDIPSLVLVANITSDYSGLVWMGPGTADVTEIIRIDEAGVYTAELEGYNGCTSSMDINITADFTPPNFTVNATEINCANESSIITVLSNEILREINYLNNGNLIDSGESITTFIVSPITVEVTGENGCTAEQEVQVEEDYTTFDFTAVAEILNCNNQNEGVLIDIVEDVEYTSSRITQISSGIELGNLETLITEAGIYEIELIINTICVSSTTIEVISDFQGIDFQVEAIELDCNSTPEQIVIATSGTYSESILLDAAGNILGDDLSMIDTPGEYTMVLIGENGCPSEQNLVVSQVAGIDKVEIRIEKLECQEAVELYLVDILEGNPLYIPYLDGERLIDPRYPLTVEGAGEHIFSIVDSEGCSYESVFNIETIDPVEAEIIPELEITVGETVELNLILNKSLSEIETLEWTPNQDLSCYDCLNPTFSGVESTNYQIYATDKNGCVAETETRVIVKRILKYYVPNVFSFNQDQSNNSFTIFSDDIEQINFLNLYDRWGNLVFSREEFSASDPDLGWNGLINNKPAEQGVFVYFAELKLTDGTVEKIAGDVTFIK